MDGCMGHSQAQLSLGAVGRALSPCLPATAHEHASMRAREQQGSGSTSRANSLMLHVLHRPLTLTLPSRRCVLLAADGSPATSASCPRSRTTRASHRVARLHCRRLASTAHQPPPPSPCSPTSDRTTSPGQPSTAYRRRQACGCGCDVGVDVDVSLRRHWRRLSSVPRLCSLTATAYCQLHARVRRSGRMTSALRPWPSVARGRWRG